MFLKEAPTKTFADIAEEWDRTPSSWTGGYHNLDINLDSDEPTITFGEHEIISTDQGVEALASILQVPTAFINRVERDEQQWILSKRIERAPDDKNVRVAYTSRGIEEIVKASIVRLEPADFISAAAHVFPDDSQVIEARLDHTELFLDLVVPDDYADRIGGDPKVGDITKGGLRFFQNRKQNLAPTVTEYLYRLVCTNGMEVVDEANVLDTRGAEYDDLMAQYIANTKTAFSNLSNSIEHFYDLRTQSVDDDRTGVLRRLAQESGFSERTVGYMEDLLPGHVGLDEEVSMFTLVNLITNLSNDPINANSNGLRRRLEQAGGSIVNDHAQRCVSCHSRLN